jgi:hypothetical protein
VQAYSLITRALLTCIKRCLHNYKLSLLCKEKVIVRKINRFVDKLQDQVLHVVSVVLWVIIFWRYLFRIPTRITSIRIYFVVFLSFSQRSKGIIN